MRCPMRNVACALALAATTAFLACSKTTTSLTAPTADKCRISVSSAPSSFAASGGSGSLTIATERDCTWSIRTEAPWLTFGSQPAGQGQASVAYTVAPNPAPAARAGSIVVGAASVSVSQAPAPCSVTLSRSGDAIAASGGRLSVGITTISGCAWNASTGAPWITVASGASGNGAGTVGLAVAANSGVARTGQVAIGGQTYTVTQAAARQDPAPGRLHLRRRRRPRQRVDFSGTMSGVSGNCPNVGFSVDGIIVVTDRDTDYSRGNCGDLRRGQDVRGSGLRQPNGSIKATDIRFNKD